MVTVTVGLLTTTTASIQGRSVHEYLGVVSGDAVVSLSPPRQRGIGMAISGCKTRHEVLASGRQQAMNMVAARAKEAGATVVIDIRIEYIPMGQERLLVTAVGTAVRLR
jgi:uncharacterized protein YbjQ (UPF0145 family)